MNLREQFEKETGLDTITIDTNRGVVYRTEWTEWLEQRNKEQVEALEMCYDFVQELKDHGIDNWSYEPTLKEQLKKSGGL